MKMVRFLPRIVIVLAVAVALLGGLGSGLARLGWQTDSLSQGWMLIHGPLMICGFLGTLICLERAVALVSRSAWGFAVPLINAAGAFVLLIAPDAPAAKLLITAGSLGLLLISFYLLRLHPLRYMVVMTLGALCWLGGNLLWLAQYPLYQVVHLWAAFLILTIVGERLELSRVRQLTPAIERMLVFAIAIYLGGIVTVIFALDMGIRLSGLGALLMALWLLRYDITRRTIHRQGLTRYIAASLMLGYVWLAVGGVIGMWQGALYAGPVYAALLHAFLLGFVFSMIFGHAPIILPAVTGLRLDYHPIFYAHLALLHVTLIYRMVGNLALGFGAQQWSGLLNVVAVLLFLVVTLFTLILSNRPSLPSRQTPVQAAGNG
jgi:hypothetical protein